MFFELFGGRPKSFFLIRKIYIYIFVNFSQKSIVLLTFICLWVIMKLYYIVADQPRNNKEENL